MILFLFASLEENLINHTISRSRLSQNKKVDARRRDLGIDSRKRNCSRLVSTLKEIMPSMETIGIFYDLPLNTS